MNAAEQFLVDAEAYLARGRALLAAGEIGELPSLDAQAAQLSAAATPLLAELKATHNARFLALLAELEAFSQELQEKRSGVMQAMSGLQQFRRAGIAYATADASDKGG